MKRFIKKLWTFLCTMLFGIFIVGMAMVAGSDIQWCVKAINNINTGTGWNVILDFIILLMFACLAIYIIHDLGSIYRNSLKWKMYKQTHSDHNKDDSNIDETSNEAVDSD